MTRPAVRATARTLLVVCGGTALLPLACTLLRPRAPEAPAAHEAEWRVARRIHDLDVEIAVRSPDEALARAAIDDAFREAERVGGLLVADWPGSETWILAHVPGGLWLQISPETHAALALALQIAEETDGAYDPTWTPLLAVWGLRGPGPPHVPRDFEIDMMLRRVGFSDLELGEDAGLQARRRSRRTEVDLGALARGAMLDAACRRLRSLGMRAGRASTRFEHAVFGGSRRSPWRLPVDLRAKDEGASAPVGFVLLRDGGLAVASPGPDIPTASGVVIHDRFDPRSGRPTRGVRFTAVAGPDAASSGARAEALLAMGPDAPAFARQHDLHAAVDLEAGGLWTSSGIEFEPVAGERAGGAVSEGAGASRPDPTAP